MLVFCGLCQHFVPELWTYNTILFIVITFEDTMFHGVLINRRLYSSATIEVFIVSNTWIETSHARRHCFMSLVSEYLGG